MAIVAEAVIRIGRRVLKNEVMIGLAGLSFIAIFFFNVPFPFIILTAGLIGYLGGRLRLAKFDVIRGHQPAAAHGESQKTIIADTDETQILPSLGYSLGILFLGLMIWFAPVVAVLLIFGPDSVLVDIGTFFSKAAVVTFGGAYAVLAYIAQQAVETYGWLHPGEMLDGLGMAETTPGPLIQVVQFVGFMGAYRQPGLLSPMMAGMIGSILTTWVTFVPCFLWIFLGAPYIEYLRGNKALTTALSAITAAVVGVVLNLALWFALHTLFGEVQAISVGALRLQIPVWTSLDVASLVIAFGAFVAIFRFKQNMLVTLGGSALAGLVYYLIFRG
jgi:chromate transporter